MRFQVKVPATAANMGPGFDCLGIALELFNVFIMEESRSFKMEIRGEGKESLPRDKSNLVFKAIEKIYQNFNQRVPPIKISCDNNIPLSRGLGSSASAVLGGMMLANRLLGDPLTKKEILPLAIGMEGHPDNIAPALFGGCQIIVKEDQQYHPASIPFPADLRAILFIPDFPISTNEARQVLQKQVSREDAVYNIGRVALLTMALSSGKMEHLKIATQDRLHQPDRKALFPSMDKLFMAALEAGALGAFLSGSGSTIMALTQGDSKAAEIAAYLERQAGKEGLKGYSKMVPLSSGGASIVK